MSGLDRMFKRLEVTGGDIDGRLVRSKYDSFKAALQDSYQGEWITTENGDKWRCLINRDKISWDYDRKMISIDFESGIREGSTFFWNRTGTHWIVYEQQYTEEAYFRAEIERCDNQIEINEKKYWVYLRGPVETTVQWRQKHNLSWNDLNYSLCMHIVKNEETNEFFTRFQKVKFDNHTWQIVAVDRYSQKDLIEVYLDEDFDNPLEDAVIVPEIIKPDQSMPHIEGPQFCRAFDTNLQYVIKNSSNGTFVINSNKAKIVESDANSCIIDILASKATNFDLLYKVDGADDIILNITVESMF